MSGGRGHGPPARRRLSRSYARRIAAASRAGSWWWGLSGSTTSSRTRCGTGCDGRRPARAGRPRPASPSGSGHRTGRSRARGRRGPAPCGPRAPRRGPRGRSPPSRPPGSRRCRRKTRRRLAAEDRLPDPGMQQPRQDARVQAAGTEDDDLRLGDRGEGVLGRPRRRRASIQTRSMPCGPHDRDWPLDDVAVARAGVEVDRRRARPGTTWPRTARTRFIRRTPSSKSPPSSAVIAASSRLPTAWPARPWPSAVRERRISRREPVLPAARS